MGGAWDPTLTSVGGGGVPWPSLATSFALPAEGRGCQGPQEVYSGHSVSGSRDATSRAGPSPRQMTRRRRKLAPPSLFLAEPPLAKSPWRQRVPSPVPGTLGLRVPARRWATPIGAIAGAAMENLLNFSQPLDVSLLEQVVSALYQGTSPEQVPATPPTPITPHDTRPARRAHRPSRGGRSEAESERARTTRGAPPGRNVARRRRRARSLFASSLP